MNNIEFRSPTASEIECKAVAQNNHIEITLYCRAETCANILNETVGNLGWEKEYTNNNKNCIVRIWDENTQRMISKEDCGGGPTDLDGLKGQASNGFKRACALGWGLGIELYSQPKIVVSMTDENTTLDKQGNHIVTEEYEVAEIEYENKKIIKLVITDSKGNIVFPTSDSNKTEIAESVEVVAHDEVENDDAIDSFINEDLPDNTDMFEEPEENRFEKYAEIIESEIVRVHVRRSDVLRSMQIDDMDKLPEVDEEVIQNTINKLKGMKTYVKKGS